MTPQWDAELFRFEVPTGCLDPGLCHPVAAGPFHQVPHARGVLDLFTDDHRCENFLRRHPRRICPLVRVTWPFAARDLAPTFAAVGVLDADQYDPSFISAAKARLKKMDEREVDLDKFDTLNLHIICYL